jgi:hypothetical protein
MAQVEVPRSRGGPSCADDPERIRNACSRAHRCARRPVCCHSAEQDGACSHRGFANRTARIRIRRRLFSPPDTGDDPRRRIAEHAARGGLRPATAEPIRVEQATPPRAWQVHARSVQDFRAHSGCTICPDSCTPAHVRGAESPTRIHEDPGADVPQEPVRRNRGRWTREKAANEHRHQTGQQGAGILQPLLQPDHGVGVEVVGRLVEEQRIRRTRQRATEVQARAPVAGEVGHRVLVGVRLEAQPVQQLGRARAS